MNMKNRPSTAGWLGASVARCLLAFFLLLSPLTVMAQGSVSLGANFGGLNQADSGPGSPITANIAVGPNYICQIAGDGLAVFSKSGQFIEMTNVANFNFGGDDPMIVYDPTVQRWAMCAGVGTVYFAISNTSDPTQGWHSYLLNFQNPNDGGRFGFNASAYFITYAGEPFNMIVIDKSSILANTGTCTWYGVNSPGTAAYMMDDTTTNNPGDPMWFFDSGHLYKMTNYFSNNPAVTTYSVSGTIASSKNGEVRNGTLVGLNEFGSLYWTVVNLATATVTQSGTIPTPAGCAFTSYAFCSQGANGDIAATFLGYSGSYREVATYVTGRAAADAPGTMRPPVVVATGENVGGRFGDYGSLFDDPATGTFWACDMCDNYVEDTPVANFGISCQPVAPLQPVMGFGAAPTDGTNVNIQWNPVSGATGYVLMRSTNDLTFTTVATLPSTVTNYTDQPGSPVTGWYYEIVANSGTTTNSSATQAFQPVIAPAPPTYDGLSSPGGVNAGMGLGSNVQLSWNSVSGANGYYIQRAGNGTTWTQIATTGSGTLIYTDTNAAGSYLYCYRVGALDSSGGTSTPSSPVSITNGPSAPARFGAYSFSPNQVELYYGPNPPATGYTIYRSTNGVDFSEIGTEPENYYVYVDDGVVAGTQYWYEVVSKNSQGSSIPAISTVTPLMNAPTGLALTTGSNQFSLTWTAAPAAVNYLVQRSTDDVNFSTIATTATTGYVDTNVTPATPYYYQILTTGSTPGSTSLPSSMVSGILPGTLPAPWQSAEVYRVDGNPNYYIGAAEYSSTNGTFTLATDGYLLGGAYSNSIPADAFYYAYLPIGGDGMIEARVATQQNTNPNAQAGVMIRDSLDPSTDNVIEAISPDSGAYFQYRQFEGGATVKQGPGGSVAPYWVKLVRKGATITGYYSPDGSNWTQQGSVGVYMGSTVYVGLADCSGDETHPSALNVSTFDNVSVLAASSVTATVSASGSTTLNLMANVVGPSGATLSISNLSQPASGTVVNNGDGTVTYTAAPGLAGNDSFVYTISDGLGDTATATVTVADMGMTDYWKFDDGGGNTAIDSCANGYNGTLINGPTWTTGTVGGALAFNGTNQYVSVSDSNVSNTSYAVSFWFKTTDANGGLFEVNNGPSAYDRDIWLSGGNLNAYVYQAGSLEVISTSGTNYADGNWHQVVHMFGGAVGGQELYVDGVLRASGVDAYSGFTWETNISIGYSVKSTAQPYFNGSIDEVRLYNNAPSSSAVSGLYSNPPPSVITPASASSNPVVGSPVSLSVSGSDAGGATAIIYTWTVISAPPGAPQPYFMPNGSTAAKNASAVFGMAGVYTLGVTISDANGKSATSTVTVTVSSPGNWINSAGGSWMTSSNWQAGLIQSGAGSTADFSKLSLPANATVTLDGTQTAGALLFGDTAQRFNWTLNSGSNGALILSSTGGSPLITVTSGTTTINGPVSGIQGLEVGGTGTLVLSNSDTLYGSMSIGGGSTLVISGTGVLDSGDFLGAVADNGSLVLASSGTNDFSGIISGTGSITENGPGMLKLSGSSIFSGGVVLTGGTLMVISPQAAGLIEPLNPINSQALGSGTLTLNGGMLMPYGISIIPNSIYVAPNTNNLISGWNQTPYPYYSYFVVTGPITGSGTITLENVGYTLEGNTFIDSDISGFNGTLAFSYDPSGENLQFDGTSAGSYNGSNASFAFFGNGAGSVLLEQSGTFQMGALSGTCTGTITPLFGGPVTLQIGALNTSPGAFTGSIDDFGESVMSMTKVGTGTLTLGGISRYTGPTMVSNGTLCVLGALLNSTTTVYNGATLSGSGFLGPVIIASGGILAPGVSGTGSLNLNTLGSLTLNGTTVMEISKTTGTATSVQGITTVTYGGTLSVTNLSGTLALGDTFTLFSAASYSGSFSAYNLPALASGLEWNLANLPVNGTISVVSSSNQTLTSIGVSPAAAMVGDANSQQFTATAYDQYGERMQSQPSFTWSGSGVGSLNSTGLYTASYALGSATVTASSGTMNGSTGITVTNAPPTVATPAAASSGTVSTVSTTLSVLGADADGGGESNLTYTWAATSVPSGSAAPTFSANGTNGSKNTVVTFSGTGAYAFTVTITDQEGATATSIANVTVTQALTSVLVTPVNVGVVAGGNAQLNAAGYDQFSNAMGNLSFTWAVASGTGSVTSGGLYSAPSGSSGTATVTASCAGHSGSDTITVTNPSNYGIWTNTGGGSWTNSSNWLNGGIPSGSGYTADFSELNISADATVTLDTSRTIGKLLFSDTTPSNNWILNTGTSGSILTLSSTSGSPVVQVNNQTATINAVVAGTQGLVKSGSGTLVLGGADTYTGTTTVLSGSLNVTGALPSSAVIALGGTGSSGATFSMALPANTTIAALTTGSGATGSTLILNESGNAFLTVGGTAVINSALTVTKANSGGVWAGLALNGMNGSGAGSGNDTLIFSNAGGLQGYIQGNGGSYTYGGNVHFKNSNWVDWRLQGGSIFATTASVTLDSGAFVQNNSNGTNYVFDALNGAGTWNTFNNTTATLTIGSAGGSGTFSGIIENVAGTANVMKTGTGTETFSGACTYTGTTAVNGGVLNILGSIASSAVTVSGSGTLAGTGTTGAVTITGSGTLAPGVSGTGTLSLGNHALTLSGTTVMEISASSGACTSVQGISTATYGGTLNIANISGTLAPGQSFTLFNATTYSGSFAAIYLPTLTTGTWNTANLGVNGSISIMGPMLTTIAVSPSPASLGSAGTQQFTATGYDQYGHVLATQPSFTWSQTGAGAVSGSGLYTASYGSGIAAVLARSGSVTGSASVTVTDAAPTVSTAASASPNVVNGSTTSLSVLGADSDGGGEPNLTYTWAATSVPGGASAPAFSANGTNASKNTTATFSHAGNYTLTVTITDLGGQSTSSSVNVTVNQTFTSIAVAPATVNLGSLGTQQFAATANDQFGSAMASQPGFTWTNNGSGSVNSSGLYTAPYSSGQDTVTASSSGVNGSAGVTITDASPTVVASASASPSTVSGSTTTLSVLGGDSDGGGEANLTYTWAATSLPNGASAPAFSANGTNASKNTTAVFSRAGAYTFTATITDKGGMSASSSVNVTVNQSLTSIALTPGNLSISEGNTQQLTASGNDQFGNALSSQPSFTWAVASGIGSVSSSGLYSAPIGAGGTATVTASSGSVSGTDAITIIGYTNGVWIKQAGGSWTSGTNWQGGSIASGIGCTADFSTLSLPANATVTLDGTQTVATLLFGDTASYGWTLNSGSAGSLILSGTIGGTPNIAVYNQAATIGAVISGTQGLLKSGTGTLSLIAANTYTGTTTVAGGTMTVGATGGGGSISSTSPVVIGSNGSLGATLNMSLWAATTNLVSLTTAASGTNSTLVLSPQGTNILQVTGTVTLNSALTVKKANTGGTYAIFEPTNITGTGAGSGNDTLIFSNAGGEQGYIQGSAGSYTYGGNVHFQNSNGVDWRLQGGSIFATTASVTLDSGALVQNNSNGTNYVFDALNGAGTWNTFNSTTAMLTIGSAGGSGTFSGVIENVGGTTNVVKTGTGTETFSGACTYTGTTAVNGGVLNILGSIAGSAVTVNSGATLSGTGTTGAVTVAAGGNLAPGVSGTGSLSLNSQALSLSGTATMEINQTTGAATQLKGISTVTYGGALNVANLSGTLAAGNTFTLFSATSYSGSFSSVTLPILPSGLYWNTSNLAVNGSISVIGQTLTSVMVTPATASLGSAGAQQFTAMAYDQYNNPMVPQPGFTWSMSGSGSINSTGLYTGAYATSSATVQAATGGLSGTASVTVTDAPPTIVTSATATPSVVSGSTTSLSVSGTDTDGGDTSSLTYTWAATSKPSGAAAPTFSINGSDVAMNTTATFSSAGTYTLAVTITDLGGAFTTSTTSVTVNQTLTSIAVTPANPSVLSSGSLQLTGTAYDQFGNMISSQPSLTWAVASGPGSITSGGLYTPPAAWGGTATVDASASGVSGSDTITVINTTAGIWTNASGGSWKTSGNWQNGIIPNGSGYSADFSTLSLGASATVTLDASQTVQTAIFGDTTTYGWILNTGSSGSILTLSGTGGVAPGIQVKSQTATVNAVVTGTQGLVKSGTGALVLGGANTYTGTTTVLSGSLNVTGSIPSSAAVVIGGTGSSGASFAIALPASSTIGALATGSGATGSTLILNESGNALLTVSGTAVVNSALTVTKANVGGVWVGLILNGMSGAGAGIGSDTLILANPGGMQGYIQGNGGSYTYSGNVHFLTSNGVDWRLQGGSIFATAASVTLDSGAFVQNNSNGTNFAFDALNGAGTWNTFNSTTSTLTIGSAGGSGTFSGVIENAGGTTNVVKTGSGTETFSGISTYSGTTGINGGTLNLAGSIASSAITVNSGGTLAGTGTAGATTVSAGGTLAPGISGTGTGALAFNNKALTLSGTTAMQINASTGASSQARGISTVTYGGTLDVTNLAGSFAAGNPFALFNATAYSGSFSSITLPSLPSGLSWNTSDLGVNGSISVTGTLPSGWSGQDIGSVGTPGSSSYSGGVYTVNGSGAGISGSADAFQLVSQGLTGDGQIRAQITSMSSSNAGARAGLMIRSGSGSGAINALLALTPSAGFSFQSRGITSGSTAVDGTASSYSTPNNWVMLATSGTLVTAYVSQSGTSWTEVGTVNLTMTNNVMIGLAVTGGSTAAVNTATFANVSVTPFPSPWISADIGSPGIEGSAEYYNGVFTVKGSGNINSTADNFHLVYQTLSGTGSIASQISAPQNTGTNACLGVMIRSALTTGSPYAYLGVSGSGTYQWQTRSSTGGSTSITPLTTGTAPNIWVMVTLTGSNTFTGYTSTSGTSWTQVGSANISMGLSTYMGMVDASGTTSTLNTSQFQNVTAP